MEPLPMTPLIPRALKLLLVIGLSLSTVTLGTGCHRRRSAMRPVIVSPEESVTVAPSAECEPGLGTSSSVELGSPTTDAAVAPSGIDVESRPSTPSKPKPAPSKTSPPALPDLGEPELSLPDTPRPKSGTSGSSTKPGVSFPELNPPSSVSNPKSAFQTGPATGPRVRQVSNLQERLRPWVNDPEDLFAPPKADRPWKYIVIHHSANPTGSYAQIDREHRKIQGWDGCGYHFVIGNGSESPDGQIEVARRWANQKQGLHCRNGKFADINEYGIGICLIGDFDEAAPSPKQVAAVKALVAYLSQRYNIPQERIGTHGDMAATKTSCPGTYFPGQEVVGKRGYAAR